MFPRVFVLGFPLLAAYGLWSGGLAVWLFPLVTFGLVPLVELFIRPDRVNLDDESEARAQRAFDVLVALCVPLIWMLVALFLLRFERYTAAEAVGAVFTLGIALGTFGINVGHELGHRRSMLMQNLAKAALMASLYVHFFIEHNRGHHAKVATPEDPVYSPRGTSMYGHWLRAVPGTWMESWNLEEERLARKGRSPWTWDNEHIRLQLAQLGVIGFFVALAGPLATLGWIAAAVVGFLLLESVNYIEHYGLERRKLATGKYERVLPIHSWNSDHPVGRVLLFELTRHSDHHANPGRPYQVLRSFPEAPQFPTGYPGMVLLATVPPLFYRVMHPRLAKWENQGA
jgi:alkane 1-monooxygenase